MLTTILTCPVCEQSLSETKQQLQCANNHSFDRHKKGYINLLLAHHKNTKSPGDSSDMVKGRRAFLRAGHYEGFAKAIAELAGACQFSDKPAILDAGCGEGYYTEYLQQTFTHAAVYGIDISKPAIVAAANNKTVQWCVASSHRLPFENDSIDTVVSIFSPIELAAFSRVLKPGGYILYAGPGLKHLQALRTVIYDELNEYSMSKHYDYFDDNFTLVEERSLEMPIQLNSQAEIMQLLSMTPHVHRLSVNGRQRLNEINTLSDVGDFKLYLYQKC